MPIIRHHLEIEGLPVPRGPFSQGVTVEGRCLHVSGQGPYDPDSGGFVRGTIAEQTRLTLACIDRVIKDAGGKRENVVSCRVYLQPLDTQTFAAMNAVYQEFFGDHKPARATLGTQLLNIDVEIECIVALD
jgi:2-iminobutanoate/2-iminopropanoate deaminase